MCAPRKSPRRSATRDEKRNNERLLGTRCKSTQVRIKEGREGAHSQLSLPAQSNFLIRTLATLALSRNLLTF